MRLLSLICLTAIAHASTYAKVEDFSITRNTQKPALEQFKDKISKGKVIVDFYAPWCGPCKKIGPIFEAISNQHADITFIKVDIDQFPDIKNAYSIRSIPQLFLFNNGTKVHTLTGGQSKNNITKAITSYLK